MIEPELDEERASMACAEQHHPRGMILTSNAICSLNFSLASAIRFNEIATDATIATSCSSSLSTALKLSGSSSRVKL